MILYDLLISYHPLIQVIFVSNNLIKWKTPN